MTHSWSLGEFEVGPGLVVSQYLYGGPTKTDHNDPDSPMILTENVSWTLYNTDLRDRIGNERRQYTQCWAWELSITEDQAIVLLKGAGYSVTPGKAGLCRVGALIVTAPKTKSWEISKDFFPEAFETFKDEE